MTDTLTLELARFFINAWRVYLDESSEEMHNLITETPFIEEHVVTQEEYDADEDKEWEVDDIIYILSPLGKEAESLVDENEPDEPIK